MGVIRDDRGWNGINTYMTWQYSGRGNTQIRRSIQKTGIFWVYTKIVRSDLYTWVSDTRVWYYVTYTWVSDTRVWISGQCGWDLLVWHNFLFWRRFLVYLSNNIYRGQGDKVFWPPVWFSSDEKKLPYIFCLFSHVLIHRITLSPCPHYLYFDY